MTPETSIAHYRSCRGFRRHLTRANKVLAQQQTIRESPVP